MTTAEIILTIIVAIFGSSGMWAFVTHIAEKRSERTKNVQSIKETVQEMQKELEVMNEKLDQTHDLSLATARDRLNYVSHKYQEQGYIPKEDYVPYKMIGDAYIKNSGNTVVAEEFINCIENLPKR
jgi:vacuolar-type H+-ATPase subunit I/STV1